MLKLWQLSRRRKVACAQYPLSRRPGHTAPRRHRRVLIASSPVNHNPGWSVSPQLAQSAVASRKMSGRWLVGASCNHPTVFRMRLPGRDGAPPPLPARTVFPAPVRPAPPRPASGADDTSQERPGQPHREQVGQAGNSVNSDNCPLPEQRV